jgi:hypothetical protein
MAQGYLFVQQLLEGVVQGDDVVVVQFVNLDSRSDPIRADGYLRRHTGAGYEAPCPDPRGCVIS